MVRAPASIAGLEDAAEEIDVGAHRVLGGELDVVGVLARELHRPHRLLDHLVGLHAQLVLHVDGAGGDEGVHAPRVGALDRLARAADVVLVGARERAHGASPSPPRATAWTASKSPGLEAAKPASITSTRMRSSCLPMRTFSSRVMDAPGLCSPSRMVVSKMINWSCMVFSDARMDSHPAPALPERPVLHELWGWRFLARGAQQQQAERERAGQGEAKDERSPC